MNAILSPSLLSADFSNLASELSGLHKAGISWLHLDVMDGSFVPNITFGPPLIKSLRKNTSLFFDTHLMIEAPERYIADFAKAGADLLVVHLETMRHAQKTLALIHDSGLKAGLALNPGTDINLCRWLLPYMDMLLIMGVNPGFSGQKFIPETVQKTKYCRQYLDDMGYDALPIQVDGGVTTKNAAVLIDAGAAILVSGSAFFAQENYKTAAQTFEKAIENSKISPALIEAQKWQRLA